jgi:hypothetical protein
MRALCVVAIACLALVATEGCRRPKREPVPGPQAGILGIRSATFGITSHKWEGNSQHGARPGTDVNSAMRHGAVGITWFQGTVDEAFSRAGGRRNGDPDPHAVPMCPGSMPAPEHLRRGSSQDDDA